MIPACRGPFPAKPGPPGPPESVPANRASSLGFAGEIPAPVLAETGATNRGQGPAA